jgi:hypothetical protein
MSVEISLPRFERQKGRIFFGIFPAVAGISNPGAK